MFFTARSPTIKAAQKGEGDTAKIPSNSTLPSTVKDGQVRRSAGEIELRISSTECPRGTAAQARPLERPTASRPKEAPSKPSEKQPKPVQRSAPTVQPPCVDAKGEEQSTTDKIYSSRGREAQAWHQKAIKKMDESGNLRRDIKATVTEALQNLTRLVKEAELARQHGEGSSKERKDTYTKEIIVHTPEGDEAKTKKDSWIKENHRKMAEMLEENTQMLKENKKGMEELKEALHKAEENMKEEMEDRQMKAKKYTEELEKMTGEITRQNEERRSYAGVLAGPPRVSAVSMATTHTVVVSSQDEMETGEEVLEKIRTAVNAREEGIRIDKIRKGKDRKIIIGCGTKEEIGRVKERIEKAGANLTIEEVTNKDPLVILMEVLKVNTNEDVLKGLRNQNGHLLKGLKEGDDRMAVKYRKKARNLLTEHVVLKVSPEIWRRLTQAKYVHIDLQRIRVADQSPLIQCARCLEYGHTRRLCEKSEDTCSHCGGQHLSIDCQERKSGSPPKCTNCSSANLDMLNHNAFSGECPVRRRWEALARAAVQYC
ncbi:unnamed protein product [Chrysodeixis includens]|uniref:Gag-like protein n=1 Tax=Chrysodeixis includens TaxID=689277 RepID=A0A9N8KZL1_CHRIL|nr:unnamed protein product [Chrysodeixis includens]CAH0594415.1 unnamed protein product [Chrysodeixis includens]